MLLLARASQGYIELSKQRRLTADLSLWSYRNSDGCNIESSAPVANVMPLCNWGLFTSIPF